MRELYPISVRELIDLAPLCELGPGTPRLEVRDQLSRLTPELIVPDYRDRDMAMCCLSGLWLLHNFLDESHSISQEIHTSTGSYWHAIMHRREADAANSKYWFRKVGFHPVLEQLKVQAPKERFPYTTPENFVDRCDILRGQGGSEENLARRMQLLEWKLLFDWCFENAGARK